MIGSDERTGSLLTNQQMMYITNIAPQNSTTFNTGGGGWNTLEEFVDGFECSDTLYVVVGTYFEDYTDAYGSQAYKKTAAFLGSDIQIPTMFYYVLLRTKSGKSGKSLKDCKTSEIQCTAFIRAHTVKKGQAVTSKEMMSVSDLEAITGFKYFASLTNLPKDNFDPGDWGL